MVPGVLSKPLQFVMSYLIILCVGRILRFVKCLITTMRKNHIELYTKQFETNMHIVVASYEIVCCSI